MNVDDLPKEPSTTPNFFRLDQASIESPVSPPLSTPTAPLEQPNPPSSTSLFWSFVRANAGKIAAVSLLALGLAGIIGAGIAIAFVLNPTILLVLFGLLIAATVATGVGLALTIGFFGGRDGLKSMDLVLTPLTLLAFL